MKIGKIPADKGMMLVTSMIKTGYVADVSGLCRTRISQGKANTPNKGFTADNIERLQSAIKYIAEELMTVKVSSEDTRDDLIALREKVCLPYIFQDMMGKPIDWSKSRISKKVNARKGGRTFTMLNHFTEEDVRQINEAIQTIARTLMSIELTDERNEERLSCKTDGSNEGLLSCKTDEEKFVGHNDSACESNKICGHNKSIVSLAPEEADLLLYEEEILNSLECNS